MQVDECEMCEAPIENGGWAGFCHDCDNQYCITCDSIDCECSN